MSDGQKDTTNYRVILRWFCHLFQFLILRTLIVGITIVVSCTHIPNTDAISDVPIKLHGSEITFSGSYPSR